MSHVSSASAAALQGLQIAKSHGAKSPAAPGQAAHASIGALSALSGESSAKSPAQGVRAQMAITGAPGRAGLDQPFGQLVKAFLLQLQEVPPASENTAPVTPPADSTAQTPEPLPPAV